MLQDRNSAMIVESGPRGGDALPSERNRAQLLRPTLHGPIDLSFSNTSNQQEDGTAWVNGR